MDEAPKRRINRVEHCDAFAASSTQGELLEFLESLCGACAGEDVQAQYKGDCVGVKFGLELLSQKEKLLEDFPPLQQASRFGNAAFRSWLEHVESTSESDMSDLAPAHAKELAGYWRSSFGNGKRLDYGTGHEASFLVWMFALFKLDLLDDLRGAALALFPRYLDLVYTLQSRYRLEPAGSHGVWSLDDFHMLPFLLGAAQLCGREDRSMASTPKSSLDRVLAEGLSQKNLYMKSICRILELKTGPFTEHSPLLTDVATLVKSWKEVRDGMLRMYRAEVLSKFPVVQHFLFGPLFPCTWPVSKEDLDALDNPHVGSAPAAFKSPFEAATMSGARGSGDALVNYFNVSRRPMFAGPVPPSQTTPVRPTNAAGNAGSFGSRELAIKGVEVKTNKARISSDAEIDQIKEHHHFEGGCLDFPLPEMLFGENVLRLVHSESGVVLEFNAFDALCCCKVSRDGSGVPDRHVFKLPNAERWAQRKDLNGEKIKEWRDDYDWTYTSTYQGTLKRQGQGPAPVREETEHTIDYEQLKKRDPILFFESVDLFEDDLFDNGESKYSVKIRVMPSCLFILARMWLRVDNTYVRCFDTRVFHKFGETEFLFETTRKEIDAEGLRRLGYHDMRVMLESDKVEGLMPILEQRTERVALE